MPHLNDIHSRFVDKGLRVLAVSEESDREIDGAVRSWRMNYPVARSSSAANMYGVRGIPNAFVIGKDGKVLWRGHPGRIDDAMINAWLGGGPLPPGSPAADGSSGAGSMFLKLGIFIMLSGVVLFLVLRLLKPRQQEPAYEMARYSQGVMGVPPAPPQAQGSAPAPPAQSAHCPHCGSPRREGRKSCMNCGASF